MPGLVRSWLRALAPSGFTGGQVLAAAAARDACTARRLLGVCCIRAVSGGDARQALAEPGQMTGGCTGSAPEPLGAAPEPNSLPDAALPRCRAHALHHCPPQAPAIGAAAEHLRPRCAGGRPGARWQGGLARHGRAPAAAGLGLQR